MVTPFPYSLGPSDDWDPQGYEDEEEDVLTPGMHVLDEDEEDDEDDIVSVDDDLEDEEAIEDDDEEDEDEEDDEDEKFGIENKSAIDELDELENLVLQTERETLKLSDFADEDM